MPAAWRTTWRASIAYGKTLAAASAAPGLLSQTNDVDGNEGGKHVGQRMLQSTVDALWTDPILVVAVVLGVGMVCTLFTWQHVNCSNDIKEAESVKAAEDEEKKYPFG